MQSPVPSAEFALDSGLATPRSGIQGMQSRRNDAGGAWSFFTKLFHVFVNQLVQSDG
jgi:hypothetical protein